MAYIDRIRTRFGSTLEPEEQIEVVVRGARAGWSPWIIGGAVVGYLIGSLVAQWVGPVELTTAVGIGISMMVGVSLWAWRVSDDTFTAFLALGVTGQHLLVFERDEVWGRTKRVIGRHGFAEVEVLGSRSSWLGSTLDLAVGTDTYRLRFTPGQPVNALVSALQR